MRMAALAPPYMAPQNTPPSPMSAMSGGMEKVKGTNRATACLLYTSGFRAVPEKICISMMKSPKPTMEAYTACGK